jgi:putative ABC transport system ATP-binding protein
VGPSGSGKSTLLNILAGLDRPTSGRVAVAGVELVGRTEDELARHRGRNVGVVFQFFQLLPTLTTLENVLLPMQLVGHIPLQHRRKRALSLLDQFGIADQASKLPTTLSGGQQQRVALARALANDPPLLVADEPTGNLDSRTAEQVLRLLTELSSLGKTVIMATHETRFLPHFDRVITLEDGRFIDDVAGKKVQSLPGRGVGECSP